MRQKLEIYILNYNLEMLNKKDQILIFFQQNVAQFTDVENLLHLIGGRTDVIHTLRAETQI